jgi:hypothetical protein
VYDIYRGVPQTRAASSLSGALDRARDLLARVPSIAHPADLDLFVFFAKHPRTLIASDQLARMLGYSLHEIAQSLDVLLASGVLTRAQNPSRPARLYMFATDSADDESLSALVELASSRHGRLALRRALADTRADHARARPSETGEDAPVLSRVRPFGAGPRLATSRRPRTDVQRRGSRDG